MTESCHLEQLEGMAMYEELQSALNNLNKHSPLVNVKMYWAQSWSYLMWYYV